MVARKTTPRHHGEATPTRAAAPLHRLQVHLPRRAADPEGPGPRGRSCAGTRPPPVGSENRAWTRVLEVGAIHLPADMGPAHKPPESWRLQAASLADVVLFFGQWLDPLQTVPTWRLPVPSTTRSSSLTPRVGAHLLAGHGSDCVQRSEEDSEKEPPLSQPPARSPGPSPG